MTEPRTSKVGSIPSPLVTATPNPCTRSAAKPLLKLSANPFSNQGDGRENFPNLDIALMADSVAIKSADADNSFLSQESSGLGLSIGATAGLNEHLRHIEKYGLEGDKSPNSSPKNPLDEQWDMLLDGNNKSLAKSSSNPRLDAWLSNICQDGSNEQSQVTTDAAHDYFNSPRVMMLATPDRNKKRLELVFTRDSVKTEQYFYPGCEGDDDESNTGLIAPELLVEFEDTLECSQQEGRPSTSLSLSDVELSHISAEISEDQFSSSDVSIHECHIASEDSNEHIANFVDLPSSGPDPSVLLFSIKSITFNEKQVEKENILNAFQCDSFGSSESAKLKQSEVTTKSKMTQVGAQETPPE